MLQVEPLYDLEDGKVVTATIVCHLEGFDLRKVLSDDAASNFDQAAAMAPELISWLAAIPGVRVTGEGKVLTHDLVRWSARYLVSEEIGEARGVLTATLTRAEGCSAVLVMDLMEWLR
ncbi:MAG: hypothetical protein HY924_06690 [Elusimicrobia bacterium]|nr:hypothetical protein [Elusimicrobiota bacterium]